MIKEKEKDKNLITSVMIPEKLWIKARIQAVKERKSFSKLVRDLLEEYVERTEKEGEDKSD
jgi:metal-responsive CopG/Arc/MetJ family transcriptional regulator